LLSSSFTGFIAQRKYRLPVFNFSRRFRRSKILALISSFPFILSGLISDRRFVAKLQQLVVVCCSPSPPLEHRLFICVSSPFFVVVLCGGGDSLKTYIKSIRYE